MLKKSKTMLNSNIIKYSGDQFGYYTVGPNFKTYSKLLAIEEMKRTGVHLEWHFNKEQYKNYNWTKEPEESLDELYRQRAQQIRDSYDYIVVFYSGGADSWCILDTFIKNNIKVDEIAHFYSYEGDHDKCSDFNIEIFYTAIPHTKKIIEENPEINHRVIDLSYIINELYLRPDVKFDFIYNIKGMASANSLARSYLREYINDYKKIIDSGKKLCFIWGTEKPRMQQMDGKWQVCFLDLFSETNLRIQSLESQGYFDEWFFWSPYTAPLVAKQCHILMKILKNEPKNSPLFTNIWHQSVPGKDGKFLRNDVYHCLIYPGWNPNTLVAPKSTNLIIANRDNWFWNQHETSKSVQIGVSGINELISRIGPYWLNNPKDATQGIKGCINTYNLE
jgi:hypothetical protein